MKKVLIAILILIILLLSGAVTFYNLGLKAVSSSSSEVEFTVDGGYYDTIPKLKSAGLIRNELCFKIYVKLNKISSIQKGKYVLNKNMNVEKIVKELSKANTDNPDQISITFKEGLNIRKIAKVVEENTNNTYDDFMSLMGDKEYIKTLINKYWFLTDDILNEKIYYPLEGYLFPETYRFNSKNVTVKEIFEKLLNQMDKVLTPLKEDIEKNKHNIHEILTLASLIEKEVRNNEEYRKKAASVFENRIKRGMSLGSDVSTYYALKIDNAVTYIKEKCKNGKNCINYKVVSPYNTRLTDGSMNGKLPIGPISTVSEGSIKAVLNHEDTNYIYFISNIKTGEMFFYSNAREFEAKKAELSKINGGL